ncbi:hypothetical protein Q4543_08430 [Salipiger sp. 1_MG-2023]|uniref:hypothetical protein n=1 Tax=Salipiger sp. 1_MG-2023 TaxID=3062665 RepID=UPI0026E1FF6D|nr:hypothetical protein [Salipiger sp. 1_MG-2023]MDO6585543.1 hypothetical protein [Salipiger sp. 1_MG-2023]
MTAVNQFPVYVVEGNTMTSPTSHLVRRGRDAVSLFFRLCGAILGSAMVFAAFALWIVVAEPGLADLMLVRFMLSLGLLIGGLCCLVGSLSRRR